MKRITSSLAAILFCAAIAAPAFAQGGMGDGPGGSGGRGPSRGPDQPPGSGEGGEPKKDEPKAPAKPQIEAMDIVLKFVPGDIKSCEAIEKTLAKIALIKKLVVTPGEAKMSFTGNWDQLVTVQNAAGVAKLKGALVTPGIFTVDCAPIRSVPKGTAAEALAKVTSVAKTFGEGARVTVFGPMASVDPRTFDATLKDYGWKFVALRSHRLRTLSYEPWEKGIRPEKLRERLMQVPGVLRVDVDPGAFTVSVLVIRETAKDLDIVSAAEDVMITIFPGKAEEDEEPAPEPAKPAPAGK